MDPLPYRPTSLDFINRPNPVEPHTDPEKHPLNGTPRLEKQHNQEILRALLESNHGANTPNDERPAKYRKTGETSHQLLDLPKLPAVRNGTKRPRLPPTLSGLHHPPPDAGLLPSMSVDQPPKPTAKSAAQVDPAIAQDSGKTLPPSQGNSEPLDSSTASKKPTTSKRKHKKWTDEETASLLKGVARFGIGNWTKILKCSDYTFENRTALDLKDRFRVCCPDEYAANQKAKLNTDDSKSKPNNGNLTSDDRAAAVPSPWSKKSERMSSSEIHQLGIDEPFEKSKRRQRTAYSKEEDFALLNGFRTHGNSWAAIQRSAKCLKGRTATDLRDRLRTRFPDDYAKAGLAPKVATGKVESREKRDRVKENGKEKEKRSADEETKNTFNEPTSEVHPSTQTLTSKLADKEPQPSQPVLAPSLAPPPKKHPPTSVLHYDDVFWGAPFDAEDTVSEEHITLDRRILDWPHDVQKHSMSNDAATSRVPDAIDSLATLNLPMPTAGVSGIGNSTSTISSTAPPVGGGVGTSNAANAGYAALPSLAAITSGAGPMTTTSEFAEDQLELPSLMGGAFGVLESDGRGGAGNSLNLMSLDELLS